MRIRRSPTSALTEKIDICNPFFNYMETIEYSPMQSYCHMSNYCYYCFLVDPQDPEILCNGLCYQCHGSKWDTMKHRIPFENIEQTLNKLPKESKWFILYEKEYKSRLGHVN
jgi:hypothetical protein